MPRKSSLVIRISLARSGPDSFDCSGLVVYCLRQANVYTRRLNAAGLSKTSSWKKITDLSDVQRGDLLSSNRTIATHRPCRHLYRRRRDDRCFLCKRQGCSQKREDQLLAQKLRRRKTAHRLRSDFTRGGAE
jgi:hypothetical protein